MSREYSIAHPQEMENLGASFAQSAKPGDIFALVGPLGSGKTHWTKGFLSTIQPETSVTSPTFSLVNEYTLATPHIYHFDFYRLKSPAELINLGWDDYLDENAIIICEWANLFPELMPHHTTWLDFSYLDDLSRSVKTSTP
jgi:tRNA threonylcarbamoyladenosine biosynthesis protein TsaE